MGEVPQWYRLLKAAQYLGTTPWELERQPWRYVLQAQEAQQSEAWAKSQASTSPIGSPGE
jgi:hypothetical protein